MPAAAIQPVALLERFGPGSSATLPPAEARAMCRRLTLGRYENFSVLTRLVPADRRDDFAAIYAFCRWADDLADEAGSRERALELLGWWRGELDACWSGAPRHPVFVALAGSIEARNLPRAAFEHLIDAFEADQRTTRYETWEQLIGYCRGSADPVGRLVLAALGEPDDAATLAASDATCTALQLTNHWQDVARDALERDRIYLPRETMRACGEEDVEAFEARLVASARAGHGVDREFLEASRRMIRSLVERTWPLFEAGDALLPRIAPRSRPIVWLFAAGGRRVLRAIETWNYETALHRPRLSAPARARLLLEAAIRARIGGFGAGKAGAS